MATYAAPVPQVVAHHVEHEQKGWTSWITTTDHKRIGIMYMVLTFMFFCLGGVEALMMRLQLGAPYSYEEMVVPTETTVTLDIVSEDVVHSWWIPELGGKFQAVPGYHNYTWFKIPKPGIYRGQCAALCGRGHARMIATVKAVPPAQFDAWLAYQKQELKEANAEAATERAKLNSQVGPGRVENP